MNISPKQKIAFIVLARRQEYMIGFSVAFVLSINISLLTIVRIRTHINGMRGACQFGT